MEKMSYSSNEEQNGRADALLFADVVAVVARNVGVGCAHVVGGFFKRLEQLHGNRPHTFTPRANVRSDRLHAHTRARKQIHIALQARDKARRSLEIQRAVVVAGGNCP